MTSKSSLTLEIICGVKHWESDFSNACLWNNSHRLALIIEDMNDFVQTKIFSWFYKLKFKQNSEYIWYLCEQKMANHILEMAGLELICDHILLKNIAKIRLPIIHAAS